MADSPLAAGAQSELVPDTLNHNGPKSVRFLQSMELNFQGTVNSRPPLQQPPTPGVPIGAFFNKGERMTPELEKRVMDIEMGRVKMTRYTPDEYMRHIEEVLGG